MVIRGGENIYPREIEEFLYTHPDIADVQVIGVPDQKYGEELCAWVKMKPGADPLDADAVRAFATGKLAHYKIPRYVMVVDEFPMTVTGKIRKVEMRERVRQGAGTQRRGARVTDTIETLADEYWAAYLADNPTEAHLLGHYPEQGRFEDASRAAEDRVIATQRDLARRAEAIDPASLDEQQQITRLVLVANATAQADLLEARLTELGADPIFGIQAAMPLILGMLRLPTAEVAEAMAGTLEGVGQHYRDLAERHRDGVDAGRTPAAFAVTDTVAQLDAVLAGEVDSDPLLEALRPPEGLDVAAWRATLASVIEKSVRPGMAEYRDVLRDVVLPQARPDEHCGLHWLDGGADAYERTLRYFTTTRRSAQDIHDVGLAQVAAARRRVPRPRTRRRSAPTTSARSSRRCAPTRPCTSRPATSWWRPRRWRWPGRRRRWATGSRWCPRPRAPSRAR